jgi:hypothetical protein
MPRVHRRDCIVLLVFVAALAAGDAGAAVSIVIDPEFSVVAPGAEFSVSISFAEDGDPINGYDAVVGYDPTRLELILPLPRSAGEGPLFTEACPQRFLNIAVAPDSTTVTVSHVILCAGVTVTGPGETYRLDFRARDVIGQTHIALLEGTAAYDAGNYVEPLESRGARVWVGDASAAPVLRTTPQLIAVPNPFNPRTELRCELDQSQSVSLDVFDATGRRIATIFDGWASSGPFRITWDGRDERGRPVASGAYFARLTSSVGVRALARMVLIR